MRKLPGISLSTALLAFALSGCASGTDPEDRESPLADLPFVYKMTVQQGNIVTEEQVDQLATGMTRRQVRFVLGTPLLVDFFNTNRWDYTYTIRRGHQPMEIRPLTLYFEGDNLARIEGSPRPDPARAATRAPREIVVPVPDHTEPPGLIARTLRAVGLEPAD